MLENLLLGRNGFVTKDKKSHLNSLDKVLNLKIIQLYFCYYSKKKNNDYNVFILSRSKIYDKVIKD